MGHKRTHAIANCVLVDVAGAGAGLRMHAARNNAFAQSGCARRNVFGCFQATLESRNGTGALEPQCLLNGVIVPAQAAGFPEEMAEVGGLVESRGCVRGRKAQTADQPRANAEGQGADRP